MPSNAPFEPAVVERGPSSYQLAFRAAVFQPKWYPMFQLIPDGVLDPWQYLEIVKGLDQAGAYAGELLDDLHSIACSIARGVLNWSTTEIGW